MEEIQKLIVARIHSTWIIFMFNDFLIDTPENLTEMQFNNETLTHSDSCYDRRYKHWHHHPTCHSQVVLTSWDIIFLTASVDLKGNKHKIN